MTDYKRPDTSTLRFRFDTKRIRIQDVKDFLLEENDFYSDMTNVDIGKIVNGYNKKLRDISISNYLGAELPIGLGVLFLGSCKITNNRKFINHSASAKAEKIVYSDASETGGNILKIFYVNSVSRYNLKNKELWSFTATKSFKSIASKYFKDSWRKCVSINQKQDVSDLFKKDKKQKVHYDVKRKIKHRNYDDINIKL